MFLHIIIIYYRPSIVAVFFVFIRSTHGVAQAKTEHHKGKPSKTTCREICRYYINAFCIPLTIPLRLPS